MRPLGLYLHIPFCKAKCIYCDFYSLPRSEEKMDAYTEALRHDLIHWAAEAKDCTVDTIYFGGGTPSYLGADRLCRILETVFAHYHVAKEAEITTEANPDSAREERALRQLRSAGFNRISLGMQSANDEELRLIGRVHTHEQTVAAVRAARAAGFDNVSLDLIYGLPEQSMARWRKNLDAAIPDDDAQAEEYLATVETLARAGYRQYEISNFARPGRESRHNLKYWHMEEYAGFGPGAHSDFGGVRYAYVRDLDSYISGRLILSESESDATLTRDYEYVMLSLRTAEGIDRRYFETTYRQRFQPMEDLFVQYECTGLAARTENGWRLTPRGFLVSNSIIVALEEALAAQKIRREQALAQRDYRII